MFVAHRWMCVCDISNVYWSYIWRRRQRGLWLSATRVVGSCGVMAPVLLLLSVLCRYSVTNHVCVLCNFYTDTDTEFYYTLAAISRIAE